jgi:Xaa-Pro aminopeptidase
MKQDLDRLMEERGLDGMIVAGKLNGNPPLFYMVNGAKVINGYVFKKRGSKPVMMSSPIDREVALTSGLEVVTTNKYDYEGILKEKPDQLAAMVELYRRVLADLGLAGKIGFYGMLDQATTWSQTNALKDALNIEVFGEFDNTIIDVARSTKDAAEVERIREMGRRTTEVFRLTVEFLKSHAVKDEVLVQADGSPLTIGGVHKEINRLLSEQSMDVPEGIIFSIGRDAGVPHNKGNAQDVIRLGKSIIFDMGTREANGGYYYDMTRSFCLGYAPAEVQKAYDDVKECIEMVVSSYEAGVSVRKYQRMAFDFFESRGHPTTGSNTQATSGFVHGLGHGIGLAVHEEPFFTDQPSNHNILQPGHIFTCEPGLYYPEKGFGVRIEDVINIDSSGKIHDLTVFPKELVVKM